MNSGHQDALKRLNQALHMVGVWGFDKPMEEQRIHLSKKQRSIQEGSQQDAVRAVSALEPVLNLTPTVSSSTPAVGASKFVPKPKAFPSEGFNKKLILGLLAGGVAAAGLFFWYRSSERSSLSLGSPTATPKVELK